jgi:hypothetical protein
MIIRKIVPVRKKTYLKEKENKCSFEEKNGWFSQCVCNKTTFIHSWRGLAVPTSEWASITSLVGPIGCCPWRSHNIFPAVMLAMGRPDARTLHQARSSNPLICSHPLLAPSRVN